MPTYTFKNKDTGEVFDKVMKIAEKEPYLKDNPNISPVLTVPNFVGDHIVKKMDGGMKETLQKIADKNPNTPLADRFSRRSSKDIQKEKAAENYGAPHHPMAIRGRVFPRIVLLHSCRGKRGGCPCVGCA